MRATDAPLPSRRSAALSSEQPSRPRQVPQASARPRRWAHGLLGLLCIGLASWALACGGAGGGSLADTGGVSGTGISQGSISAFGSIFVNGVEWDLGDATIRIDGTPASENDLRLGMVVRVEGDFGDDGLTGSALSVDFDAEIKGPIATDPVLTPGLLTQKTFEVLGQTIRVDEGTTIFDDGASFAGLARDQVVEVSGFVDDTGTLRATRVELEGEFPTDDDVELRGTVSTLMTDPDGTGSFNLGPIMVHFDGTTSFSDVTPQTLANGDFVEVEGFIRQGTEEEVDAVEIELEQKGFGDDDLEQAELEGIVTNFVGLADFRVAGIPVDASNAILDPATATIANGDLVEVEGRLESGVLIASRVELEDDDDDDDDDDEAESVQIEAAVSSLDGTTRSLTILGIRVEADGDTLLEDDRDEEPNFRFEDILPGDWLQIEGLRTGPATVVASSIERDDDGDDVRLEGPVTSLDGATSSVEVVDRLVPIVPGTTVYFDDQGVEWTEAEFFRSPGLLMPTDRLSVIDFEALDPGLLGEADEVAISND